MERPHLGHGRRPHLRPYRPDGEHEGEPGEGIPRFPEIHAVGESRPQTKGLVPELIDPDGKIFGSIEKSLTSVEGMLDNLEGSSSVLKSEMPQLGRLMEDLRITLTKAQDVLEGLKNNPLLKNGPEPLEVFDLAERWKFLTGLPFVFAFWAARPGFHDQAVADALRQSRERFPSARAVAS